MILVELLYISHTFKPLNSPWMERLRNNYLYLAHDDDYWTKIHMKDVGDFKNVIHGKTLKWLKGRKKVIEPILNEILDYIFKNSQDGILVDFENSYFNNGNSGVRIYKIGKNYNYDKICEDFRRKENFTNTHIILEYNSRTKKWKIYGEWK